MRMSPTFMSGTAMILLLAGGGRPAAQEPVDTSGIFVKKAIAETMAEQELQAYKARLARNFPRLGAERLRRPPQPETPGDTCPAATYEIGSFPMNLPDTTVGAIDDYDLPPDVLAPTCTAPTTCTGAGPAASLPRGAIYTGTGRAPDRAFKLQLLCDCTLTVTATPNASWDLALIVYQATCSNDPSDCVCVDDTGFAGQAETVVLNALANTDYFVVIDGYSTQGTPPTGPYTLTISADPSCNLPLCPVELQRILIE